MDVEIIDPVRDGPWILDGLQPELVAPVLNELVVRTSSHNPPIFLAAIEGGRIEGLVAFRQHCFTHHGLPGLIAFQAAGVLTAPRSRGKGIFPKVVNAAEDILRANEASVIFGFPNASAYPIWTNKLGYQAQKLVTWRAPARMGFETMFISPLSFNRDNALMQDNDDLINSKRVLYNNELLTASYDNSLAWGIQREIRKFGRKIQVLDIGGVDCQDGRELRVLIKKLIRRAAGPHLVRLQTAATNPIIGALRLAGPAQLAHEVVIFKDLNSALSPRTHFSLFSGAAEWF